MYSRNHAAHFLCEKCRNLPINKLSLDNYPKRNVAEVDIRTKRKHDYGLEVATTSLKKENDYNENADYGVVRNAAADVSQQATKAERKPTALVGPKPSTSSDTSEYSTNVLKRKMVSPMHSVEDNQIWNKNETKIHELPKLNKRSKKEQIPAAEEDDDDLDENILHQVEKYDEEMFNQLMEIFPDAELNYLQEKCRYLPVKLDTVREYNERMLHRLMEIFPEAEPNYLREKCWDRLTKPDIDDVITDILSLEDYPKRDMVQDIKNKREMHYEMLKQLLPNADPTYLRDNVEKFESKDDLEEFVSNALERHDYPTYKEYIRKQQLLAQARQYTCDFSVEKYLELIPDPENYFKNPEREAIVTTRSSHIHVINFLKVQYPHITVKMFKHALLTEPNILEACHFLDHCKNGALKRKRSVMTFEMDDLESIPLLQLFAYLKNKKQINDFIKMREKRRVEEKKRAKEQGLLQTCGCCYEEEVMPSDAISCTTGCVSCKTCIERSVEIAFGEGKLDFPCLLDCGAKYTLQDLQNAVNPKLFSKLAQKKQLEEITAAGIEELEGCPFCEFATIPAPNDKVFKCLNPECMKESCRLCKEPSHVPLKCEEVEKDCDVKKRTYVEDKMTEALIRKCWKCSLKFIKADGCNRMTCSCGAMMCYICNQPVSDYKHFNGQGGDRFDLCPLYSDTNKLHEEAVLRSGQKAKEEIGAEKLKNDPTADINLYYKEMSNKNPSLVPPGMNPALQLNE